MNFSIDGTPTIPELLMPNGYKMFWILVLTYLSISSTIATFLYQRYRQKSAESSKELEGLSLKPFNDAAPPSFPRTYPSVGSPGRGGTGSPVFPTLGDTTDRS